MRGCRPIKLFFFFFSMGAKCYDELSIAYASEKRSAARAVVVPW